MLLILDYYLNKHALFITCLHLSSKINHGVKYFNGNKIHLRKVSYGYITW